jgi:hypothetical protein
VHDFLKATVIAAASGTIAAVSFATSHGPLPAHTGAFGEPTCQRCHSDYALNDGAVSIGLPALPQLFEPGRTYPLQLRVQHPDLKRAGFQIAARFEDGSQAGSWQVPDTTILRVQRSRDVAYLSHAERGTLQVHGDTATWEFIWQAPPANRPVIFSVAVNVSNYDASEFGDRIFTASFVSGGEPVRK